MNILSLLPIIVDGITLLFVDEPRNLDVILALNSLAKACRIHL